MMNNLTGHLKTPDFFDVAKFPKATFVSTKIERQRSTLHRDRAILSCTA